MFGGILMGFLEFIGDFIAEFWIQLTQPKKKGFSPKNVEFYLILER